MQAINNNNKLETHRSCSIGFPGRNVERLPDFDACRRTKAAQRLPGTGERVLVMLRAGWQQPGFAPVVGLNQGLFIASSNAAGKPQMVYGSEGQMLTLTTQGVRLGPPAGPSTGAPTSSVDLATFKQWV